MRCSLSVVVIVVVVVFDVTSRPIDESAMTFETRHRTKLQQLLRLIEDNIQVEDPPSGLKSAAVVHVTSHEKRGFGEKRSFSAHLPRFLLRIDRLTSGKNEAKRKRGFGDKKRSAPVSSGGMNRKQDPVTSLTATQNHEMTSNGNRQLWALIQDSQHEFESFPSNSESPLFFDYIM